MSCMISHGGVPVKSKEIAKVSNKYMEIKNPALEKAKKIQRRLKKLQ